MDSRRVAEEVVVPHVVGLPVAEARRIAENAGVVLAQPDPDGPPLAALTWPGDFEVAAQRPAAGAVLRRWDSVVVDVVPAGGTAGVREPRRPLPDPVRDAADQAD